VGGADATTLSRLSCGTAPGRYRPSFFVDPGLYGIGMGGPPGMTSISLCAAQGATAKVVLFAPRGVALRLDAAPGTVLGRVHGKVQVGSRTFELLRRNGNISASDRVRYRNNRCAPGLHDAVWLLRTSSDVGNVRLALPLYLDAVTPTTANGGSFYRLQLCAGSLKRRISGGPAKGVFRLLDLSLDPSYASEQPQEAGAYVWHAFFTPFRTNGSPNPAATVESRAAQLLPVVWTLSGTYDMSTRAATLAGRLTQGGLPVAGLKFVLWHGTTLGGDFPGIVAASFAYATTDAGGRFTATVPINERTYFRASGSTVLHYSRCGGPSQAPKGCVSASRSGFATASAIVAVPVP
jgi:hypothetical protein